MDKDKSPTVYSAQTTNLVLDTESMNSMMSMAGIMASGIATVPKHFQKNQADCLAMVMQAAQWGLNPFLVAQKTFLVGGKLGYEAQLIHAVATSCKVFEEEPEFTFIGSWEKILGRVTERKSDQGGKYYVKGWNDEDEAGLGVICSAVMRGGRTREITTMMSQCFPRLSTQWATDPQQQITYVVIKKLIRRYAPGVILGVYTDDELQSAPMERDITPESTQEVVEALIESEPDTTPQATEKPTYPNDKFKIALESKWKKSVNEGKDPKDLIKMLTSKYDLTQEQKDDIMDLIGETLNGNA